MTDPNKDEKTASYEYVLWVPPHQIRKVPALNARWEPFLGNFLMKISDHVSRNRSFYDDLICQETETTNDLPLVNFFGDRDNMGFDSSAYVLKGAVGIGKSSFLQWWLNCSDVRFHLSAKIDINHEAQNVAANSDNIAQFIQRRFADILLSKLKQNTQFNKALIEIIGRLKTIAEAQSYDEFKTGFQNQSTTFREQFPDYGYNKLLTCVIYAANTALKKPVWLLIDNVDLESPEVQQGFVRAAFGTYDEILNQTTNLAVPTNYHVVVTARPETINHWQHYFNAYQDIEYKDPDVLRITRRRLFEGLDHVSRTFHLGCNITIGEGTYQNAFELCEHIKKSIGSCIRTNGWPFQEPPAEWHLYLVNRNVRRFVKAWVHFINSGNFLNIWAFPQDEGKPWQASPYKYLRMLIRGPFNEFPGNSRIDYAGEDPDSPLVFNLFNAHGECSIEEFKRDFFIYIRIMQHLTSQSKE